MVLQFLGENGYCQCLKVYLDLVEADKFYFNLRAVIFAQFDNKLFADTGEFYSRYASRLF